MTIAGGGRHEDGSEGVIADEVVRVLSETVSADTVELLEDYAEARGRDSGACEGVADTVAALRMGQVRTLVLTDDREDGSLFFGPDPAHVALTAEELLDLGVEQPWSGPLDEVLVRAALGTGADVRFVTGGVEQAPRGGVGALLRFDV